MAAQLVGATIEKFEDIARGAATPSADDVESGINVVWWIAFVVSLLMWLGLIGAVVWVAKLMIA